MVTEGERVTLRLSRQAKRDLASISRYTLQEFGPQQEERYLEGLFAHLEALCQFPLLGREVDAARRRRVSIYEKHLVLYTAEHDSIAVARVLHSAQQAEYEKALRLRADL